MGVAEGSDFAADGLCVTLTDNGSLRPEATRSLRMLAAALGERIGRRVHPVSLLHSSKIPPERLDGRRADILEPFMRRARNEHGVNRFCVVPLFFGPSAALAEYLPMRVREMRQALDWPELDLRIAPWLVDTSRSDDSRIARILAEFVRAKAAEENLQRPAVAVIDHGTPREEVALVRNHVAAQVRQLLPEDDFPRVAPCSMERRPDPQYDFNEPLLERLLGSPGFDRDVVVSMLFLQPGRHAGADGDVAEICARAEGDHPNLRAFMTNLVGAHPALIDILSDRYAQGIAAAP